MFWSLKPSQYFLAPCYEHLEVVERPLAAPEIPAMSKLGALVSTVLEKYVFPISSAMHL